MGRAIFWKSFRLWQDKVSITIHSNGPFLHITVEQRYWGARVLNEIARKWNWGGGEGEIKFVTPSPHPARGNNTFSTHWRVYLWHLTWSGRLYDHQLLTTSWTENTKWKQLKRWFGCADYQLDNYQKISHFKRVPDSSIVQQQHLNRQTNKQTRFWC